MKRFITLLPFVALVPVLGSGVVNCGGGDSATSATSATTASSTSGTSSASSTSTSSSATSSSSAGGASSSSAGGASSSSSAGGASSSGGGGSGAGSTRPQLTDAEASDDTILKYLAKAGPVAALVTDNWDPTAGIDLTNVQPTFTVAADNSGTQTTVQAAITAAVAMGGVARIYILVKPGTYDEVVCVPSTGPLITLYGADPDATEVTIVANHSNPEAKAAGVSANPCNPNAAALTYGTSGSATFAAYSNGFQAKNITFQNNYDESLAGSNQQAVALMTQGDQLIFDNVRVLGNQDTFYVKTPATTTVGRVYFKGGYVEGDVDFIFGRATLVMDGSTINYLTARQGSKGGTLVAPSTAAANVYGFLIINGNLTAQAMTPDNLIDLGRAWDESVVSGMYMAGVSPNGQALIRDSMIGAHIRTAAPWATSTSGRAFSSAGNRLTEYQNTGPGSAMP